MDELPGQSPPDPIEDLDVQHELSRRDWLTRATAALSAAAIAPAATASAETQAPKPRSGPFALSLNTSTISGQKLPITEVVDIAAKAGYDAVEPWIRELDAHVKAGHSLDDLGKRIADHGLIVPSAIGFFDWCVGDDARRGKALEQAKREMEMVRRIGGTRIAAPPAGATNQAGMDLLKIAERYKALLDVGAQVGVTPQVEVWGFSKTLSRLGEAALVAMESKHTSACVLADVYHLYKGGSDFSGLKYLSATSMHVFHINDYPSEPPRAEINDAARVYPGDGVAPLAEVLQVLKTIGFSGVISLELFNREYWKQDAFQVAKTGLEKTRAAVHKALG